ncbi:hypothetical protein C8A05DRAFT_18591 [Staphylotrichum tortipilum]|uniref:JmjC domain-containing protein n=1 Tax=Staphylotrichum tortipilum TaxID=2831512 RepID=A0AAN6MDI3_9PEZI|nr:hypothetical protein C8A05DRAFT_18591 [Staphylotrichum longicolle]
MARVGDAIQSGTSVTQRHLGAYSNPLEGLQLLKGLQLPDITNITKPSGDVEQDLEDLYRNLPKEPIPYYVGPLSGSIARKLQSYFPSGSEVEQLGDTPGVSTLFGHVGEEASGTAFHCEDANLRSFNLTLIGWKIWIMIQPHHTAKFEDLVQRLTNCDNGCDQFVRHTSVVETVSLDVPLRRCQSLILHFFSSLQYHARFRGGMGYGTNSYSSSGLNRLRRLQPNPKQLMGRLGA